MRYNKNSYLEIEENQAILFFEVVAGIRKEINKGSTKGRTYNDFIKSGISKETMSILKASKFITWHNATEPVWISWSNNLYPDRTIASMHWELEHHLGYNIPMLESKTFDN